MSAKDGKGLTLDFKRYIIMYKQSYIVVMENGKLVKWTVYAENIDHGGGLAIAYAV